jgi:hypothetical protein
MRLYLGYIPIWMVMLIIIMCDLYIIWAVYLSIIQHIRISSGPSSSVDSTTSPLQRSPSSNSEPSHSAKAMSRYLYINRQVFFRFALGPFLMIILHLPGSILRFSQATDISLSSSQESFWSYAQAVCDPMHGSINAVVWVLSDRNALKEWYDFLCRSSTLFLGNRASLSSPTQPAEALAGNVGSDENLRMSSGGRLSLPLEYDSSAPVASFSTDHRAPMSPTTHSSFSSKRSSGSRLGMAMNKWTWGMRSESSQERHTTTSLPRQSQNPMHPAGGAGPEVGVRPSGRPQFVTFESETEDSETRRSSMLDR